jgi:uncharacterized protein YndB with AHSA1/START domain
MCNQTLQESDMEYASIEREIFVHATPDLVFEVVSSPDHLKHWWPDDAHYDPAPGSTGEIVFGDPAAGGEAVPITVVGARPPHTFSFRWGHPTGETANPGNSLLVTFDLTPSGDGTMLKMTETGFREQGWSIAQLEQQYQEHSTGWSHFLPRLIPYVATLEPRP